MLEEMKGRKLVDLFKEGLLKVGDEIPYNDKGEKEVYSSLNRNGYGDQYIIRPNMKNSWQILGIDLYCGREILKLISKEPLVPINLQGATGVLHGPSELSRIAFKLYGSGEDALLAKNFDTEELAKLLQLKYAGIYGTRAAHEGYMEPWGKDSDKICLWQAKGRYAEVEGYTPELFLAGAKKQKIATFNGFIEIQENFVWNDRACQVLFYKRQPYWIADKGVVNLTYICEAYGKEFNEVRTYYGMRVGFSDVLGRVDLFVSTGEEYTYRSLLRPVVYLHPDATYKF